ncbi:Barley B recombinant-like protein B [Apostasia shenzhenica]|uniref:GAGA-binding transcriptional activator n=1 Tax=Apostasia shenzhenica TaxID=1088818 RepID=A0A2I0B4R7_9ASPA|nr:Barley B recombinant-like protein B [Apostasia shenzhenica]
MDADGKMGSEHWGGFCRPAPLRGNLGLQLMSDVVERGSKPFFFGGRGECFFQRECGMPEPSSMPIDFVRDFWYHNSRDSGRMLYGFHGSHHHHLNNYGAILSGTCANTLQMLQSVDSPREENAAVLEDPVTPQNDALPLKKMSQAQSRSVKASKQKRNRKAAAVSEESAPPLGRRKSVKKSVGMVINGIDLDLSEMPSPVCTCTGNPHQCYRWGAGGWQSACCTTSISIYPLPMSMKRRGVRIAGRKMSHGAFKKVLEKLAGEGQDFSYPIDLKPFWAKHGTNKFVTIR